MLYNNSFRASGFISIPPPSLSLCCSRSLIRSRSPFHPFHFIMLIPAWNIVFTSSHTHTTVHALFAYSIEYAIECGVYEMLPMR